VNLFISDSCKGYAFKKMNKYKTVYKRSYFSDIALEFFFLSGLSSAIYATRWRAKSSERKCYPRTQHSDVARA